MSILIIGCAFMYLLITGIYPTIFNNYITYISIYSFVRGSNVEIFNDIHAIRKFNFDAKNTSFSR